MNPDQTLIQSAYADAIKVLYAKLFDSFAAARGNTIQEQEAEQRFTTGLQAARTSRDRAVALLA
jgi:hypothetical protein